MSDSRNGRNRNELPNEEDRNREHPLDQSECASQSSQKARETPWWETWAFLGLFLTLDYSSSEEGSSQEHNLVREEDSNLFNDPSDDPDSLFPDDFWI